MSTELEEQKDWANEIANALHMLRQMNEEPEYLKLRGMVLDSPQNSEMEALAMIVIEETFKSKGYGSKH